MTDNIEKVFSLNDNVSATQEIDHLMESELDPDPPKEEFKYELRQWFTAFGAIVGSILAGVTGGFSAVLIPQLEFNSSFTESNSTIINSFLAHFDEITIETTSQKSWLGFSGALLLAPGCWLSGLLIEKLGRRMTHLVITPLYFLSWVTITMSSSFTVLVIGRLFSSFFMGLLAPACPVYIAETTNPRLRGILLGGISVAASAGNLLAHAAGTWLNWRIASLWCGSLNIICFIICFLSPESPTWFLKRGKIEKASIAWRFLRGPNSRKEFEALKNAHALERKAGEKLKLTEIIVAKSFLKPLGIVCLVFFTAQCSGVSSITFYSVDIFRKVADPKGAFMWTLLTDVVKVLVSGLTCWLIKRVSNRGLALISGAGTALVLFSLAVVQYYDVGNPWTPVVLLITYNIASFIGLVPLSWMLCGELFPTAFKGLGTGFTSGFGFLCLFLVVLLAPYMFEYFLAYGTFFIFGCVAAVGTSMMFFYLPETRGKTLLEIERSFDKTKRSVKNKFETNGV